MLGDFCWEDVIVIVIRDKLGGMMNNEQIELDFLISSISQGKVISTDKVLAWMKRQNEEVVSNIKQIPLEEVRNWGYRDDRIRHESGKFFSIDGIRVSTNYRDVASWDQPIINQPEIITKNRLIACYVYACFCDF